MKINLEYIASIFIGCYLIYLGFDIMTTGLFNVYYDLMAPLGIFKYPVSVFCIFAGFLIFYKVYKEFLNPTKQIHTEHTICPNCKQTYNYKDLKDGKCPTCKETNTIEIEQYYKDNPFKDEDEN